ncbi:MAG: pseudouridine synthase, partial [Janthinobacterium lividum]
LQRPEAGTESNPFGGRPVKVPRARVNNAPRRDRGTARVEAAATPGKIEPQRIAKLLARAGVGSRRDIERFIAEGRVSINGTVLTTPAHIIASLDGVTVNGNQVAAIEATRLFRFHKPAGFLTTARDPGGRPTIFDALPQGLPRLVPVGRLDMNTEGLLLLTTDGTLKRQLELPLNAVSRRYRVRAYGEVTQAILEGLIEGIEIDGMRYGPINADIERRTGRNLWLSITLTEGKNRELRRVLEFLGLQVSRLIRVAYGPFELGDLGVREVEEVNPAAIEQLRRSIGKQPK